MNLNSCAYLEPFVYTSWSTFCMCCRVCSILWYYIYKISHIWVQLGICDFFPRLCFLFWKARIVVTHAAFVTENLHKLGVMFLAMWEVCRFFFFCCDSRILKSSPYVFACDRKLCEFKMLKDLLSVWHFNSAVYLLLRAQVSLPLTPLRKWFISDTKHSFIPNHVILSVFWLRISGFLLQLYYVLFHLLLFLVLVRTQLIFKLRFVCLFVFTDHSISDTLLEHRLA